MKPSIRVENLSKAYQLGQFSSGTISRDIERWWAALRGKEDPFLKIGESNDRSVKGTSDIVWSLKDINFEIQQGDSVGIIGKNGAGKSTLLKVLSKVTSPTTGVIKTKGRIASLLEVGTGFHPELTGKENIFLNGAILGMRKWEIQKKFDEIVDFSGVERYIDTPVKRYSSGMYVRLAFAVAAHLQSEILIIDEVLAVGDAEFQKKCLGKIGSVNKGEGRTVLFVSHNLYSIKNLCTKGILLQNGLIALTGTSQGVIDKYISDYRNVGISNIFKKDQFRGLAIELLEASVTDGKGYLRDCFDISEDIYIDLKLLCKEKLKEVFGYVSVKNSFEELIIESDTYDFMPNCLENLQLGNNSFRLKIDSELLAHGEFIIDFCIASNSRDKPHIDNSGEILRFTVIDSFTRRGHGRASKTSHLLKWEIQNVI